MAKPHLTAMTRNKLSAPARWLHERGLLSGRVLDYGCGHGDIFKYLLTPDRGQEYDPYWHDVTPSGRFDTIFSGFVLNVLPAYEWPGVLSRIKHYLNNTGVAYVAVRRDIKREGLTSRGTEQYTVNLDLPLVVEKKGSFAIYEIKRWN